MQLHNRLTISDPFIRLLFQLRVFNKMQQLPIPQSIWTTVMTKEWWPTPGKLGPDPSLPHAQPELLKSLDRRWAET